VYCKADLSQLPAAAESLINTCVKELGSINILSAFTACPVGCISCAPLCSVNNAGIQHVSPIESFPTEQWDRYQAWIALDGAADMIC
jgi:NAD(P)-dependent dehydrogenase (short-subunit alcohol dehydrogenase family)